MVVAGPVAGQDGDVLAQWIELFPNAGKEQLAVAAGQVPAADPAGKQDVAADQQLVLAGEKTEAAGAMAGHFEHLEVHPEKIAGRRRLDQEVGLDRLDLEAEAVVAKEIRGRKSSARSRDGCRPGSRSAV